jgi:hypothetical protein
VKLEIFQSKINVVNISRGIASMQKKEGRRVVKKKEGKS